MLAVALATPVAADDAPVMTATGVVVKLADVPFAESAFVISGNTPVPVKAHSVAGLETGDTVTVELAIPAATVEDLELEADVAAESALGAEVLEQVEAPLAVTSLDEVQTAAGMPLSDVHQVDIAINVGDNDGVDQPTEQQIRTAIAEVSDFYNANTDGALPQIQVRSVTEYESQLPCGSQYSSDEWAAEAAEFVGRDLEDYFTYSEFGPSHLVVIGECRFDQKAAIGTIGEWIDSGGFVLTQSDFFDFAGAIETFSGLLAHEFGHNFGLSHANATKVKGCSIASVPLYRDITSCGIEEYADTWSVMGYAVPISWTPLLDIARLDQLGLTAEGALTSQSGDTYRTYTLNALGAANGLKGVKLTVPSGTYYIEYRDGTGEPHAAYLFDRGCDGEWEPSPTCATTAGINPQGPGVRVLRTQPEAETVVSAVRTRDDVPGFAELGLDAGDKWTSSTGDAALTIVATADGTATIQVSTGNPPKALVGALRLSRPPIVGSPVTVLVASTTPADAHKKYRWLRNGSAIPGATSSTYTPTVADAGTRLTAQVTASSDTAPAGSATFTASVTPVQPFLVGIVRVGEPKAAMIGTWPAGFVQKYQWLRGGVAIAGATAATYTPTSLDNGKGLSLRVTGTHATLGTAVVTSPQVTVIAGTLIAPKPVITGTARVGGKLTAKAGTWTSGTKLTYRWYANGVAISNAKYSTLTLSSGLYGKRITVKVTGTKSGYTTVTATSSSTAKVVR